MPHLQLVASPISDDTVTACRELLAAAEAGQLVGFGIVALLKRRRFLVDTCGEATRDPVSTRGAMMALDDCLREMVRRKTDSHTTI